MQRKRSQGFLVSLTSERVMMKLYGIFLIAVGCLLLLPSSGWAYCSENNYLGVTEEQPILSSIDVSSSFFYSSTSTSGTSGCQNWDFTQFLEESRKQFITRQFQQVLEETALGEGPHLEALGRLMGCPDTEIRPFARMLKTHYATLSQHLTFPEHPEIGKAVLKEIKQWMARHTQLKHACRILG